jgi:hypothetical protein
MVTHENYFSKETKKDDNDNNNNELDNIIINHKKSMCLKDYYNIYNIQDNIFYIFYRAYSSCIFYNKFLLSFFKIWFIFFEEFIYFSIIIISIIK